MTDTVSEPTAGAASPTGGIGPTRALGSRYLLERVLGAGAMGEVWLGSDRETGQAVAAKLLRTDFTRDADIVTRFIQERSILLSLVHPHIVRVRDLVVEGADLAIVMDLVTGGDLRGLLGERGRLAPAEAVQVCVDVLDALAEAHAKGVLHRDIKPDNVLLGAPSTDPGDPVTQAVAGVGSPEASPLYARLSDFGIARLAQQTSVKMTGLLGTADYMAPEVLVDEVVGPAADVYGTGIMLYELLAGHPPYAGGGNHYAIARRHELALPPQLDVPAPLWDALAQMLAKQPQRRLGAAATAAQLRAVLPSLTGVAALVAQPRPTSWASVDGRELSAEGPGQGSFPVAIRGGQAVEVDPNQTMIRGAARQAAVVLPVADGAGLQPALASGTVPAPAEDTGGTMIRPGAVRAKALDTLDLSVAAAAPRSRWRHPVVITAVVLLVLGVAAGGFVALTSKKSTSAAKKQTVASGPQALTSELPGSPNGAGLTLIRDASFDPSNATLTVTLNYSSGTNSLRGPFFESVPAVATAASSSGVGGAAAAGASTACPTVTWSGDLPVIRDVTQGIAPQSCGWSIGDQNTVLTAKGTMKVSFSLPFQTAGTTVSQADLSTYLSSESQLTATALSSLTNVTSYAAQRLEDLSVEVAQPTVGQKLNVTVYPEWVGDSSPDSDDVLYSTSNPRPDLATKVFGGPVTLTSPSCGSDTTLEPDGTLDVIKPDNNCTVTASIGGITASQASDPFSITPAGGG